MRHFHAWIRVKNAIRILMTPVTIAIISLQLRLVCWTPLLVLALVLAVVVAGLDTEIVDVITDAISAIRRPSIMDGAIVLVG